MLRSDSANNLSLNIVKTKYLLIVSAHNMRSFVMIAIGNFDDFYCQSGCFYIVNNIYIYILSNIRILTNQNIEIKQLYSFTAGKSF